MKCLLALAVTDCAGAEFVKPECQAGRTPSKQCLLDQCTGDENDGHKKGVEGKVWELCRVPPLITPWLRTLPPFAPPSP